jgi:hypothetical protein
VADDAHWDDAYISRGLDGVSWFQASPLVSLELVEALDPARDAPAIDVGGGGSLVADELIARGFTDVTVLDVSQVALTAT